MTTLKSRLRAGVLGIALAGGVTVWPAYACGDERGEGSKQSDIGAVTGLAVGAVAGGPLCAARGAAARGLRGARRYRPGKTSGARRGGPAHHETPSRRPCQR